MYPTFIFWEVETPNFRWLFHLYIYLYFVGEYYIMIIHIIYTQYSCQRAQNYFTQDNGIFVCASCVIRRYIWYIHYTYIYIWYIILLYYILLLLYYLIYIYIHYLHYLEGIWYIYHTYIYIYTNICIRIFLRILLTF